MNKLKNYKKEPVDFYAGPDINNIAKPDLEGQIAL